MHEETSPADWNELEPLLDRAMELEPLQRTAWLDELASDRPDVATRLRALLAHLDAIRAGNFLEQALIADAAQVAPALRAVLEQHTPRTGQTHTAMPISAAQLSDGTRVGPYLLLRQIGRGGTSNVWLAERSDGQLKRQVALKLPFIGSHLRTEHFLRERDMLAALTHPNIARLYDAGISDTGQPYLAMEYVEGTALLRHCDERRLTIRERLRVFLQVLEAVQFAHAALIIHRDLKPSNILLTPQGRVVLLDFGIGKLLTETAQPTRLGRALTLDYASPEQIAGQPLGVASDIYSLGVILHELLTGLRPYQPKRDSAAALEDAILTDQVQLPSRREFAADAAPARASSPRALGRALAGDLDNVVLKALQKIPAQRYGSTSAFAHDISNHLNHLPVSARPDTYWYRVGRFIQRHKVQTAAASIAVFALLGGSALALWQARVAATERDVAVALGDRNAAVIDFLGRIINEAAASTNAVSVSELLARAETFARENTGELIENRAAILEIIADRYRHLSQSDRAIPLMQAAVTLLEASADSGLRSRYRCKLTLMTTNAVNAAQAMQKISDEVQAAKGDAETAATCLLYLTTIAVRLEKAEEAERYAVRALEALDGSSRPDMLLKAKLFSERAFAAHLGGDGYKAQQDIEQALRLFAAMGREHSADALRIMNDLAVILTKVLPRRALELLDQIQRIENMREPGGAAVDLILDQNRATALQLLGRYPAARASSEKVCRLSKTQRRCTQGIVSIMLDMNQPAQAAPLLDVVTKAFVPEEPPDSVPRMLNTVLTGRLHLMEGRLAEARAQFGTVLKYRVASQLVPAQLGMAETELRAGNIALAKDFAQQALDASRSAHAGFPHSQQVGVSLWMLGRVLVQSGRQSEARTVLKEAVEHLSNTVDADHPKLLSARQLLHSSNG